MIDGNSEYFNTDVDLERKVEDLMNQITQTYFYFFEYIHIFFKLLCCHSLSCLKKLLWKQSDFIPLT